MRESNFAFPAQNRACVCITSQLYDRRALDTTSPLPLFNSLTHLTYLTSTSPRIREIMTMDGGLERLVRILHDFCMCPPPPDNPSLIYGLSPPNARPPKLVPTLNPASFDRHAAYRFSLAFQCVVNIGVRGSEPIRSRVVQAGTLEVVGCILEAWLANKGFAVGPSSSATGLPRETREQRQARRIAQQEQRQREEAEALDRALQRSIHLQRIEQHNDNDAMSISPGTAASRLSDTEASTDNSTTATPLGSNTPTAAVIVASRDRSGTIIARTVWDDMTNQTPAGRARTHHRPPAHREDSGSPDDTSRPETETEDDGDGDVEMDEGGRRRAQPQPAQRRLSIRNRTVGIASENEPVPAPIQVNADAHIIINDAPDGVRGEDDGVAVEDGLVSLEPNDDFAMGAPPGAPGAIEDMNTPRTMNRRGTIVAGGGAADATPRAGAATLPMLTEGRVGTGAQTAHSRSGTIRASRNPIAATNAIEATATVTQTPRRTSSAAYHHHRGGGDNGGETGPYRDEDVLLSLQLLAYLSKYPHVRQAFYKPCVTFHPASASLPTPNLSSRPGTSKATTPTASSSSSKEPAKETSTSASSHSTFYRAFPSSSSSSSNRAKEKTPAIPPYNGGSASGSGSSSTSSSSAASTSTSPGPGSTNPSSTDSSSSTSSSTTTPAPPLKQTNVFSLVERFTFRLSSSENDLPNPPPKLPVEIQYWASVIMRNACRKDDSRGGIRQCANMLCGRWESYPREFAKCRRCRKAKYCGKECQSTAWSEGHRFWCSAKEGDDDPAGAAGDHHGGGSGGGGGSHRHHHDHDHPSRGGGGGGGGASGTSVSAPPSAGPTSTSSVGGGGVEDSATESGNDRAGYERIERAARRAERERLSTRERSMAIAGIALTLRNSSNGQGTLMPNPSSPSALTTAGATPASSPTTLVPPTTTATSSNHHGDPASMYAALASRAQQVLQQLPPIPNAAALHAHMRARFSTADMAVLRQYREILSASAAMSVSGTGAAQPQPQPRQQQQQQQVSITNAVNTTEGGRYGWSSFMGRRDASQASPQVPISGTARQVPPPAATARYIPPTQHNVVHTQRQHQHRNEHHGRRRAETITGTPMSTSSGDAGVASSQGSGYRARYVPSPAQAGQPAVSSSAPRSSAVVAAGEFSTGVVASHGHGERGDEVDSASAAAARRRAPAVGTRGVRGMAPVDSDMVLG